LKGAPHENVTRNFPTADIQPDPGHKHELERGDCAVIAFLLQMNTVYVRDKGDDKNDGLTEQTAVRSFKTRHQDRHTQRRALIELARRADGKAQQRDSF
jgi:hypothetical protein